MFGTMMTSISSQYYQIFLAQGLVTGLGCGILFTCSTAIVPTYFTTKRGLAIGIVIAGGSLGTTQQLVTIHRYHANGFL